MGAWIEIVNQIQNKRKNTVAPRMGAWIEILDHQLSYCICLVAPRMGAWIEIPGQQENSFILGSHPAWVRGLKF